MIRIQHGEWLWRDQAAQPALAFHERQLAEILPIQPQDVEGVHEWFYYKPDLSPAAESTLEEQLRASIDMVNRRHAVQAPARPSAESRLAPAVAEFSARLVLETTALVDVYAAVLKTASERHGNAVKADDVRSLLVTAYINAAKQGGRNAA